MNEIHTFEALHAAKVGQHVAGQAACLHGHPALIGCCSDKADILPCILSLGKCGVLSVKVESQMTVTCTILYGVHA
jgi:hypothetical protein